ncbi:MAG: hypothetical protein IME94_09095 [Proteobacteria bacterium]|nr:hypothetical protein [Pseudomonadota bacterium]
MPSFYLKVFSAVLTVLIALVGTFNFVVDPFDLFPSVKIKGFNAEKTELSKHLRLIKAHKVRFYQPGAIILGTSRAEYGLDPQHPAWDSSAQPVYNLALSNGRIEESLQYLRHAHAHGKLKQVVLGADFFMFGEQFRVNTDYFTSRLSKKGQQGIDTGWLMDIINSLFTLDAIFASIDTVQSQGLGKAMLYQADGMRRSDQTWEQVRAKGGHNAVFLADIHHDLLFPAGLATFSLSESNDKPSPTLDVFSELVRFCLEQEIELKVIISPMHAYKLEVLYHLGLWELFEYWKLRLTTIVENENQRMPTAETVEIWDFSVYNSLTTEPVPSKENPGFRMKWYWEGSHYRREFGDKILDCVLGDNLSDGCSLGQQLSFFNIVEHLAGIREAGNIYRGSHLDDIKVLKTLVEDTREERDALRRRVGWQSPQL